MGYLETIIAYWFTNNYPSLIGGQRSRDYRPRASERAARQERIAQQIQLALLDLVMPNGKKLRACTGADCEQLSHEVSPWLARIAERVAPTSVVGDVLSEDEVRALWRAGA